MHTRIALSAVSVKHGVQRVGIFAPRLTRGLLPSTTPLRPGHRAEAAQGAVAGEQPSAPVPTARLADGQVYVRPAAGVDVIPS